MTKILAATGPLPKIGWTIFYDFYPNWYYWLETEREILDLFPLKKFDVWRSGLRIVDFEMKISNAKNISISFKIFKGSQIRSELMAWHISGFGWGPIICLNWFGSQSESWQYKVENWSDNQTDYFNERITMWFTIITCTQESWKIKTLMMIVLH